MSTEAQHHAPLGELLVRHGGMREEHLRAALEEQQATGRPLGEIVVERGYVPAAMVAQALATQQGGLTKSEYGYATGWAKAVDERDRAIAELRRWAERANAAIASRDAEIARLTGELAATAGVEEVERLQAEAAGARAQVAALQSEVEAATREAERVPTLEAQLGAAETGLAAASERAMRVERLEQELAEAVSRADEAERCAAELREAGERRVHPWARAESHLLFVRRSEGYELVERAGPPPSAGEAVDGGTVQRVSALGGTPCAYVID